MKSEHHRDLFIPLLDRMERIFRIDIRYAIKSGFWLNMSSLVTIIGSFLVSIAFANFLPKESFGTYQYLLSILSILTAFTLTGMNTAVTRAVAQGNDGVLRASIRPQLLWNSFSSVAALTISAYYLFNGDVRLGMGAVCIAIALPLITAFNSYGAFLIGKKAFKTHFLFTTISNVLYYGAILLTLLFFPAVLPLIVVNLAFTALAPVAFFFFTLRAYRVEESKVDPDSLSYGKHLSLMNLLGTVSYQIDNFLVFQLLGPVSLATYSMATLIPERLSGVFKNITNSMLPRFSEQPLARIRAGIIWKTFLFSLLIFGFIVAYTILAPTLFRFIYPQYVDAVPYTQVFALTLLIAAGNFAGTALLAHRKVKALYTINTVTPIINLIFQGVGILLGGLWGLIIGRVIAGLMFIVIVIPTVLWSTEDRSS